LSQLSDPPPSPLITLTGVVPPLRGTLELPPHTPPYPGVILLPGSRGWREEYAGYTRRLAEAGYAALALDYLAGTGIEPAEQDWPRLIPLWQAQVRAAVEMLRAKGCAPGRLVGLVGYSLGAFLAVSVANQLEGVGAVVDYFGAGGWGKGASEEETRNFPPLLILHGEADSQVPVSLACQLRDAVVAAGGEVEMHLYPGAEHAFHAPWAPWYKPEVEADAWERMMDFLARRLVGRG